MSYMIDSSVCNSCFYPASAHTFSALFSLQKKQNKNMKYNVGDSHILAGAGGMPLVNTQRMKEDPCTLQGQRKRLNN